MDAAALDTTLERRKQLHIRLRGDLSIEPQKYEGRTYYVVKDPVSLRYYRFKPREHFLMQLMDGRHTLDEARQEFEKHFRPDRLRLEEVEGFARQLMTAGLAHNDSPRIGQQLFDQSRKHQRGRLAALTNILYIQVPVYDPDKLLQWMLVYLRWIFTTWFMLLSTGVMLAAVLLVATHFDVFRQKLPTFREFFNLQTVAYVWIALGAVKVIHEFGHGLSCKAFGGECHDMGALILCLSPCLYCNVSDAWTLPSKWKRIIISFAGIYVELIIASLATFIWWNTASHPLLNHLCLSLMLVCSVSTVLFNGNPLMRYDGYYILADWLEIPNLRDRANRFLKKLALAHALGVDVQPEQAMARWRRVLFVTFALTSYLYRWVLTYGILWFLYTFLKPYKLGAIGAMLALASVASMVGWPVYHFVRGLLQRGRLPPMKAQRLVVSAGVLGTLLSALWLVPLPVSGIRQAALVQLQPNALEKLFVPAPAILERLYVHNGQPVQANDVVAEFRSIDLENLREEARSLRDIAQVQWKSLQELAEGMADPAERSKIEVDMAQAASDYDLQARRVEVYDREIKRLVLRAPRAGVVMGAPRIDEVGKLWHHDEEEPFCVIGDPSRLRALVPIPPADYHLLEEEMAHHAQPEATIRVQGTGLQRWRGKVASLPESEAREIPLPLTNKGGGPVAVTTGATPNSLVPQTQQYLLVVDFVKPGGAIYPGVMAQVKIRCRPRSCAWWVWRTLSSTLDLGLL